ncbi:lipid-A-disaccharide synthase [Mesorhizobium xinjiangense]|uniref:lipid-A-disaccharide synthase n=1 Tax=Mesorhizobium xinjiangense TaxID=2678685 RepID=UPI0012ED016F|nr:lipid-A-disaccharide synthase [Mesorhizobium xinjiangense]
MAGGTPLRVAIVAGEESGDLLGADLVDGLIEATGRPVELIGVGGAHLAAHGLDSLFDPGEIALMGVTQIVARLPQLMRRISSTAAAIARARPDCLITIDSPDFSLRVARKVKAACPDLPVIHYVCPSVWAWRPERARKMAAYVDRVLCILPFEAEALKRLDGPPGTYVGHRLAGRAELTAASQRQRNRLPRTAGDPLTLLLLPGSRRSEVRALIDPFRQSVAALERRGYTVRLVLPTVEHVRGLVEEATADWSIRPEIVTGVAEKYAAFGAADVALAASGTVSLELALARVPTVLCYKADFLGRLLYRMITVWSAALPNLIADRPVVPEFFDQFVRPEMIARHIEQLARDSHMRAAQLEGFDVVRSTMETDRPSGVIAAEAVLSHLDA